MSEECGCEVISMAEKIVGEVNGEKIMIEYGTLCIKGLSNEYLPINEALRLAQLLSYNAPIVVLSVSILVYDDDLKDTEVDVAVADHILTIRVIKNETGVWACLSSVD